MNGDPLIKILTSVFELFIQILFYICAISILEVQTGLGFFKHFAAVVLFTLAFKLKFSYGEE